MEILVNGSPAVMSDNFSIEYNIENPAFSGAEGYSMSISFPLEDCEQNIAIFGRLTRKDADTYPENLNCRILDKDFTARGILVIQEVSETEVKAQFLEGRSELNYKNSFDDIYINSFSYGKCTIGEAAVSQFGREDWKDWFGSVDEINAVALPWVYDETGSIQNVLIKDAEGWYRFDVVDGEKRFTSRMPYLLWITKKLCENLGYSYDFSAWEATPFKHLVIANPIPAAWYDTGWDYVDGYYTQVGINDFSYCLPEWSVTEFFDELALLLNGEFHIDHIDMKISFDFCHTPVTKAGTFYINNVLDAYSVNVNEDPNNDYKGALPYIYAGWGNTEWNFLCCPWFIKKVEAESRVKHYDTLEELIATEPRYIEAYPSSYVDNPNVLYAKDVDTYFIMTFAGSSDYEYDENGNVDYAHNNFEPRPINNFAPSGENVEGDYNELRISPARIDETESGRFCVFAAPTNITEDNSIDVNSSRLTSTELAVKNGEDEKNKPVAYDSISVVFWNPDTMLKESDWQTPVIDTIQNLGNWNLTVHEGLSLRLNNKPSLVAGFDEPIDAYKLYKFSFLSDVVPNVRSVFFIHGKKYVCAKLSLTFNNYGRSQLIKGEFYRISNV